MKPAAVQEPLASTVRDVVPLREKAGLAGGRVLLEGSAGTLHILSGPILNITLGVNPAAIGTVIFIQRLWDALLDPLLGQFSDNFRSRWGRRLPLMALGAPGTALLFAAMWWLPESGGDRAVILHFAVASLVFFAFHTLYAMPLNALAIEATDDTKERTRLIAFMAVFAFVYSIGSQWIFPLTQMAIFDGTLRGLKWVTGGCALLFLVAGCLPLFLCRERHYRRVAAAQAKVAFWPSFVTAVKMPPLRLLMATRFISMFGYQTVAILALYMNMYYVFGGDVKRAAFAFGFLGSTFHAMGILSSLFVFPRLAARIGKVRTLQWSAWALIIGCASKLVFYREGEPWWQFIVLAANGVSMTGITLMSMSMVGDIADYDDYQHGTRREALLSSVVTWTEKAGSSFGALFSGYILVAIGFSAKAGAQTPQTLLFMKLAYVVLPAAGALAAIVLIRRYQLNEETMAHIKQVLVSRRAAAAAGEPQT